MVRLGGGGREARLAARLLPLSPAAGPAPRPPRPPPPRLPAIPAGAVGESGPQASTEWLVRQRLGFRFALLPSLSFPSLTT